MQGEFGAVASGSGAAAAAAAAAADRHLHIDDWRFNLQPDARQRIVNKIMDTLQRHLPVPVPEGLSELQKIAVRFEEKIYAAATSQSDYLRKISLKMLSMETKTQPGFDQLSPFLQEDKVEEKQRKCKICGDCSHKRRNS